MIQEYLSHFAASCTGGGFLGFPTWYKYLEGTTATNGLCAPSVRALSDVWLIGAAVIEILLRIAVLVAVIGIVYGGFNYITSQGEPDKTAKARSTIINAAGGMVVAILATAIVSFIAGKAH